MSYASTRNIKATRKPHRCDGCGKQIETGSPAFYWAGDCDGEFYSAHYHTECRALECAWNDLLDYSGDEFTALPTLISDIEPDDRIWIEVEWPIVAARIWEPAA